MSDTTILYAGVFCLAMILLGIALTVYEFHKMSSSGNASDPKRKPPYKA